MFARARVLLLSSGVICAGVASGTAQTSSVAIVPSAAATQAIALSIADSDYPVSSLVANEEGVTRLKLTLGPDGKVTAAQTTGSSGFSALDEIATQVARTRWSFQPSTGANDVEVEVTWKLPLSSANEYLLDLPRPRDGAAVVGPQPLTNVAFTAADYPRELIRAGEQGSVFLSFRVDPVGNVDNVKVFESSGYPRLDEAAARFVQKKTYKSGTVDGMPSEFWLVGNVIPAIGGVPQRFCVTRPFIGTGGPITAPPSAGTPTWWVSVDGNGKATDALLQTRNGWMRVSSGVVSSIPDATRLIPQNARLVRKPSPGPCWIRVP